MGSKMLEILDGINGRIVKGIIGVDTGHSAKVEQDNNSQTVGYYLSSVYGNQDIQNKVIECLAELDEKSLK